jgi:hypothetical protein
MIKLLDIIREGAYDAQGVGDKVYEKFHIPTDMANLKAMAELQRQENGKPVTKIDGAYIFLNPKSLKYFGKFIRAVADKHGNLYVAQRDGDFIHHDMSQILGITSDQYDTEFIRLIRISHTGNNFRDVSDYWDMHEHAKAIRALREKHPNFNFISQY